MKKLGALAFVLAVFAIDTAGAPPADACGVKLAIKYSRPRRVANHVGTPSHVLLVGSPPKRLEHDLTTAGNDVEVESNAANAKHQKYDIVVVASNDQANDARERFPGSAVVVRSGDITADVRTVDSQAGRRPIDVASGREVIASGPDRGKPIAAGSPDAQQKPIAAREDNQVIAAKGPDNSQPIAAKPRDVAPPPAPTPAPAPEPVKVAAETPTPTPTPTPAPSSRPSTGPVLDEELYFSLNSATATGGKLDRALRWLRANPDVHAAIEGYADPSGTPEGNMILSQHRAETARDYLVAHGVDASRLDVTPYGDTKLKYGRADGRNRRVEITAKR